jgi:hypothetical protein
MMAGQVGPQERKPEHSLAPLRRPEQMRTFLANSIKACKLRLAFKAGYKTAADTSSRQHARIVFANGRRPYKAVCERHVVKIDGQDAGYGRIEAPLLDAKYASEKNPISTS